jgi:hypothetical protein
MEIFLTYNTDELHSLLLKIYYGIKETAKDGAFSHVRSKSNENHNSYHFQHLVENSNSTIDNLKAFYPETDSRRNCFKHIILEEFEQEAERFLNSDIY